MVIMVQVNITYFAYDILFLSSSQQLIVGINLSWLIFLSRILEIHFDDGSFVEAVRMSTSTNLLGTYSILYKIGDVADHFESCGSKR